MIPPAPVSITFANPNIRSDKVTLITRASSGLSAQMPSEQGFCSGGERTRTADFHVANVALYQLSYTPEAFALGNARRCRT